MQFVNLTSKTLYTTYSGTLRPGQVSADGGAKRRKLEETLDEIVKVCGNTMGIRLNMREAQLLNAVMNLDEKGGGFDRNSLPKEVRDDPTGEKRAAQAILAAQAKDLKNREQANDAGRRNEDEINGETRQPVGPATLTGTQVNPGELKSGFEQILEDNARIAAGEGEKKPDIGEVLDPIGAHAQKDKDGTDADGAENGEPTGQTPDPDGVQDGEDPEGPASANAGLDPDALPNGDDPEKSIGTEPAPVKEAHNDPNDGTRSADTQVPPPEAPGKGNAMDRQAAQTAAELGHLGPLPKKGRNKGRGGK